ncbi:MAG TPA: class I SAM-dependent methyltransferase [Polyangiaceae bacterium]|nr:class I SAM-dependent methyltransferase [Polyangiaceae bacterium]
MTEIDEKQQQLSQYYQRAIEGHVYIRDTLDAAFESLGRRLRALGGFARVLELGSHAGITTEMLLKRWPNLEVVVHDDDAELVALARRRLAGRAVHYHTSALADLAEPVDVVISFARHHHLPHGYLPSVRSVLKPGGVYIVADELCPEYCAGSWASLIEGAELLHVAGGYVLTTRTDADAFVSGGTLPEYAQRLEDRRRIALWRWYRFVVDEAVSRGYFDIASGELQSACDDLVTGSDAEHKFSPLIVERQFVLAGFRLLSKRSLGPANDPERQSLFVYEFATA